MSYSGLTTGTYNFALRVTQQPYRAGSYNYAWNVDRTPPPAPVVDPVPSPTSNRTANITWTDTETTAHFVCALDDPNPVDATTPCTSPWAVPAASASPLADGVHTAYVYAIDSLGNENTTAGSTAWTVDTQAPSSPVITITPAGPTNQTSASVAWTDGDATNFTCALDGNAPVSCTSPWPLSGLTEGTHVVTVQGTDAAKNVGAPGQAHLVVDLTAPPAPAIMSGPAQTTDQSSATFYFEDADTSATFSCAMDSGSYAPCTSPFTYSLSTSPTAAETHIFHVRAIDEAQNTGAPSDWSWTIDPNTAATPPEITAGPDALTNKVAPAFTFDSLDDPTATFLCSVDNIAGPYGACASPQSESVTTDGPHTFYVEEVSNASGSTLTSDPNSWSWTLDRTAPPAPTFSNKPASYSNVTAPLFSFADDEPNVTYTCQRDSATPFACVSPVTLSGLADGTHTFTVSATDAAGNTASSSTGSYTWTVDTVAPAKPTVTGPSTSGTSVTLSLSDSDTDVASYLCTLDGSAPANCSSSVDYSGLSAGSHSLYAQAVDRAGNIGQPQSFTWSVDATAPTKPTIDTASVTSSPTNLQTADFSFSVPDSSATGFRCWYDNAQLPSCTTTTATSGTMDLTGVREGGHSFQVVAVNSLGNTTSSDVVSWTVDLTAPAAPTVAGTSGPVNTNIASFTYSDTSSDVASFTCYVDGAFVGVCAPSYTETEGNHTLVAYATDAAGNLSPAGKTVNWTVDMTAPAAPTLSGPTETTDVQPSFSFTDDDATATFQCSVDGGNFVDCVSPFRTPVLGAGSHNLRVRATDPAGNATTSSPYGFVIDAPVVTPTPTPTVTTTVTPTPNPTVTATATVTQTPTQPAPAPSDTTAPTVASLTTAKTLNGISSATFSEPVQGLTNGGAALVVTGTSTVVPTNVTCLSGTTAVACTGSFTALQLAPRSPLTPGQHYTVRLVAGAVQDAAGNQLVARSANFRGSLVEQESSLAAHGSWPIVKAKSAYGGSFVRENLAGSSATYTFTGSTLTWWTTTGRDQGKATVYIDGKRKATVSNYASKTQYKVARKYTKLGNKRHTIRIVVLGVKGAKAGTGTFVSIDGFTVGAKRTTTPALAMTLHSAASRSFSGGHASTVNLNGDTVTFTFRGTSIAWFTQTSRNQGKVAVYVDGVRKAVVDNYALKTRYGVKRAIGKLADKVHTLKLVVLGTHHKGATGTWLTVDRFQVS